MMPYLIQPAPTSIEAKDPLHTYAIPVPDAETTTIIHDLRAWGWQVAWHGVDDEVYLAAVRAIDKATKKRRRRTQMVYGDMIGETPHLTIAAIWEREAANMVNSLYTAEQGEHQGPQLALQAPPHPSYNAEIVSSTTWHDDEYAVDEWYSAEIERLEGIAESINARWKGLPRPPTMTTTTTTVVIKGQGKRMSRVRTIVDKLDTTFTCEPLSIESIPFPIKPMGLF